MNRRASLGVWLTAKLAMASTLALVMLVYKLRAENALLAVVLKKQDHTI